MTTPRKTNQRTPPAKRKDVPPLRSDVAAAIEQAWPGGVVEMSFGSEESWFWNVHPKLVRALQRLNGLRMLHESGAEEKPRWRNPDDEDSPNDFDLSHSYRLFFLVPEGDAFTFETQSETEPEPEFEEMWEWPECSGDAQVITSQGRGHTGWSVAVSLIAPFAAIALSDYTVFEDGTVSEPGLEHGQDDHGNPVNPEDQFRVVHGERLFQKLEKLRTTIVGILEKHGITVLPEIELRKVVPWLRSDGSACIGAAVRVFDAFFFQGL